MDSKRYLISNESEKYGFSLETEERHAVLIGNGGSEHFRILCVDDDGVGLRLRGEILTRQGYVLSLDSCPVQALARDVTAFDLAILDYEMPRLNGVELLLAMRARHVAYPILLLSGGLGRIEPSEQRLFYRCIDKGQSVETLLMVISSYVQSRATPDQGSGDLPLPRR